MKSRSIRLLAFILLPLFAGWPLHAQNVDISGWNHQKFGLFGGNTWQQSGRSLSVASDGDVSMLWVELPDSSASAREMSWTWAVDQSVPPTDLSRKGGDDRNLSLYAIFMPKEAVTQALGKGISALLGQENVRVLMYVWGGDHERGSTLNSPYVGERGRTIVLRKAGVGQHEERVDLSSDLQRTFGEVELALVGLAVSADSDDTETHIRATLSDLRLLNP